MLLKKKLYSSVSVCEINISASVVEVEDLLLFTAEFD